MRYEDGQPVLSGEESRSGSTEHVVRYVLAISLLLVIIALTLVWAIPALESRGAI